MTILSDAKLALQEELEATDEEISFLFRTFLTSLKETQTVLLESNLTPENIKSRLHKLKGEAYSVNLNPWARVFERLEHLCLNPNTSIPSIQDELQKSIEGMIQDISPYT